MRYAEIIREAIDITNNPAFWRWFGHSKVVHPDGTPMVVYHGTFSDFTAFDPEKANAEGGAFFFIRDADVHRHAPGAKSASGYATGGAGGNVMPVYLKMERPYVTGFDEELSDDATDADVNDWVQRQSKFDKQFDNEQHKYAYYREAIRFARRNGHDGVIFKRITDDRNHHDIFSMPSDVFAVFEPSQIKSAIANRGSFDPNNPRITETNIV